MGKRILVADDSRTIQQAFAMVMDGSGYTLSFAKSVDEALAVAKRDGRPDLVLSDAVLGVGSGYDLCAQLKAEGALRDVPVYILASAQTPYDEARGRKVGADGHLAKPFESQALLDAVASALAAPVRRPSAAMPSSRGADFNESTSRYSDEDVIGEDEDSYGEITIERGSASGAASWSARPPSKPSSGPHPVPAPTSASAALPAPRPPMISGAHPSTAMPAARPGTTPPPLATPSLPPPPRQPARTMMGFPSVKPPAAPAVAEQVAPTPSRPAALPPATAAPGRAPVFATPGAPAVARHTPPPPSLPGPGPGVPARPVVPRYHTPPPPSVSGLPAPPPAQAQSVTRRVPTPMPSSVPASARPATALSAAVSSIIDQKMEAMAARGPEYEAIAKLSREIIEQVVWEVVPELAEVIIRQEVDRLASARK